MGVQERKEREKQEMRELILREATQMFLEEGFDKTSIRAIAERIEYSPATIYLYFKDKNELFYAIHNQGFILFFEKLSVTLSIEHPLQRLRKMGDLYLEFAFENPGYYDLMFIMRAPVEALGEGQEWRAGFQSFNLLRRTIAECIAQGYVAPCNVDVASVNILSLVHGIASTAIRGRFKMYPVEQHRELFQATLDNMMWLMQAKRRPEDMPTFPDNYFRPIC